MQHLNNLRQRRGSTTSTTCSTPPPHDIYTVLISEENRYIRKGYGLISAILIAVSFMVLSPQIAQYVWPSFLELYAWSGLKKWQMTLLVLWFWHSSLAVITNLVMWAIYRIELPFFERYKISQDPWPWYDNREEWNKLLKKSLALVSFNNLVSFPLAFLVLSCIEGFDTKLSYKIEDLPDTATLMCSIAFCMICEDFAFHHIHKILHWRIIYPYIHKLHHTYVMPVGISAEYSHPLEFIFGVLVPSGLGSMILGEKMHFATFLLWAFVRILNLINKIKFTQYDIFKMFIKQIVYFFVINLKHLFFFTFVRQLIQFKYVILRFFK